MLLTTGYQHITASSSHSVGFFILHSVIQRHNSAAPVKSTGGGVFVPLAWIFSQLGEIMTHLILCNFMCLVTSRRPMTRRRLDFALLGSFWYTRSWKRTSSCSSRVTLSSISLLSTWLQYLERENKGKRNHITLVSFEIVLQPDNTRTQMLQNTRFMNTCFKFSVLHFRPE